MDSVLSGTSLLLVAGVSSLSLVVALALILIIVSQLSVLFPSLLKHAWPRTLTELLGRATTLRRLSRWTLPVVVGVLIAVVVGLHVAGFDDSGMSVVLRAPDEPSGNVPRVDVQAQLASTDVASFQRALTLTVTTVTLYGVTHDGPQVCVRSITAGVATDTSATNSVEDFSPSFPAPMALCTTPQQTFFDLTTAKSPWSIPLAASRRPNFYDYPYDAQDILLALRVDLAMVDSAGVEQSTTGYRPRLTVTNAVTGWRLTSGAAPLEQLGKQEHPLYGMRLQRSLLVRWFAPILLAVVAFLTILMPSVKEFTNAVQIGLAFVVALWGFRNSSAFVPANAPGLLGIDVFLFGEYIAIVLAIGANWLKQKAAQAELAAAGQHPADVLPPIGDYVP